MLQHAVSAHLKVPLGVMGRVWHHNEMRHGILLKLHTEQSFQRVIGKHIAIHYQKRLVSQQAEGLIDTPRRFQRYGFTGVLNAQVPLGAIFQTLLNLLRKMRDVNHHVSYPTG